jgi:tetratricopeptide (TPR) repeat protein
MNPLRFFGRAVALAMLLAGCAAPVDARQRATLLVDKGRSAEAAELLVAHLREHPEAIPERRLLVRVYALLGQLGEAEKQAGEIARRLGPDSPIPWLELGFAMEFAHRYDEALALYDRAAEVSPDAAGPFTGGTRAARWGELDLAEPRLVEALRRDPRNARAWHALGVVRLKLGNVSGAERAYEAGLRAEPGALENRIGLATAALARDDARAALFHYDAILSARPRFADAYLGRSYALLKLGRLDEARKALEEGARLGASPRSVGAQRRVLAQADRRAEPPEPAPPQFPASQNPEPATPETAPQGPPSDGAPRLPDPIRPEAPSH